MKDSNANLFSGTMLLMAGILSVLNVDFDDYDWLAILPAILFTIAGIVCIIEFFKKRKAEQQNG